MANLYNNAKGVWETVDDAQVPEAVTSGTHSMESGVKVPVVAPDGRMADIDSSDSQRAFEQGFRLPNIHDQDAFYDRKAAAIQRERFGTGAANEITAAGLGAARSASFGLSDAALAAGGLGDATKAVQQENPIASTAGEVGGLVASSLLLPGGGLVGAAERVGAGAAKLGGEALANSGARAIVSKIGSKALGSAVEGAIYGGGQTVSEQALGNPEDVVDNLATNMGFGALFGGVLGGGFEASRAAKPYLVSVARKAYGGAADLVGAAARKAGGAALESSVLARGGDAELAAGARELATNPELRQTVDEAAGATKNLDKEISANVSDLDKQAKDIRSGLKSALEDQPGSVKERVATALTASDNDIAGATNRLYEDIREGDKVLNAHIDATLRDTTPTLKEPLQDLVDETTGKLASGNIADRRLSQDLDQITSARLGAVANGADDIRAAKFIKEEVNRAIYSGEHSDEGRKALRALSATSDEMLQKYPDDVVSHYFTHLHTNYEAIQAMSDAVSSTAKVSKLFTDPTREPGVQAAFAQLSTLAPEFKAFQEAASNVATQNRVIADAYKTYRDTVQARQLTSTPLSANDFKELFRQFGGNQKANVTQALDKLSGIEKAVNTQHLSNMDAAVQLRRALGQSTEDLERFAPLSKQIGTLNRLRDMDMGRSQGGILRHIIGYKTGGLSEVARAGINAYRNPSSVLTALSTIEKSANKGAQLLDKATTHAAATLTGRATERATFLAEQGTSNSPKTQKGRYDAYKSITSNLAKFAGNGNATIDHMATVGGGIEGIPNIKTAMAQKFSASVGYLQAAVPKDPLAGSTMFATKTGFQPSDAQIGSFMRKYEVVHNPVVAIHAVATGEVTPEQIEALKTVYPSIYNKLQSATMSAIMDHDEDIPYSKKLIVSQVFGVPVDYSTTPKFVAQMQQALLPADQGGRPDGATDSTPRKSKLNLKPFETTQSDADHTTYKDQQQ